MFLTLREGFCLPWSRQRGGGQEEASEPGGSGPKSWFVPSLSLPRAAPAEPRRPLSGGGHTVQLRRCGGQQVTLAGPVHGAEKSAALTMSASVSPPAKEQGCPFPHVVRWPPWPQQAFLLFLVTKLQCGCGQKPPSGLQCPHLCENKAEGRTPLSDQMRGMWSRNYRVCKNI